MVTRYQKRISGSILDRFDIHIEVPRVEYEKLSDERLGEPSINIQCRVEAARDIQQEQFQKTTPFESNSHLAVTCNFDMRTAMSQMQLSARAYHRLLKLSLTIVDLAGSDAITPTWQKRCNTDQS
jgi:magnesium chelatase family protein